MRLEWLEDILAIAQTGSFSGAAERRRLTQSAFSRRIQQIEDHVGVELFDRSRKPVRLRPTTLSQSAQIEQLSAALRQLLVDLRRGDRIASNRIVIASQHSLTTSLAPKIIQGIQDNGDAIYVRLRSANLDECFGLLLSRQADLAIVYRATDETDAFAGDYLETMDIGSDQLIPVIRRDLSGRILDGASDAELPIIAYPADVFLGRVMADRILPKLAAGTVLLPKAETSLTIAALEMAAVGTAVAWVPQSLALQGLSAGQIADLSEALPSCELTIRAMRLQTEPSPAEAAVWAQLPLIRTT
ncbi:LysR family transcriptional regulator [Tabrizicola sp. J26]|uniref:LysR family transcriptional regulator n=1 Tax=Alitabrizicola rongguiensis TaxID=2909234 RepID=UPI001F39EAD9|nr:LysR family transcriptional regulator [Tabrizicola rongguiensis]MCF1709376.1 LysR family transcriptional regulator [Tabrizicola rongguiensis]